MSILGRINLGSTTMRAVCALCAAIIIAASVHSCGLVTLAKAVTKLAEAL